MKETTIIKTADNGYTGYYAKQSVDLTETPSDISGVIYQVGFHKGGGGFEVFTYRTLRGAEKKFDKLSKLISYGAK